MLHKLSLLLLCLLSSACTRPEVELRGQTMNTTWRVVIDATNVDAGKVQAAVQGRLDALEQIFSNWRGDSAVSQWNHSRRTDLQPVPREVAEVVAVALKTAAQTDGALDITIAPLIDLWGFGPAKTDGSLPTDAALQQAKQHCGWQKLEVQLDPPQLRKTDPELTINLSTLVEGYASDAVADWLQVQGYQRVLVDVGGAINARGKSWSVGVQVPGAAVGDSLTLVQLKDEAVTTAGTYRKHFAIHGQSYSHILDPQTGRPVTHDLVSVSVFHPRAVIADGYDTALLVLGPQRGRERAQQLGLRTLFVQEAR